MRKHPEESGIRPVRKWRRRVWIVLLNIALPFVILAAIEGMLRAAGAGEDVRYLRESAAGGRPVYSPNKAFFEQFMSLPLDRIARWEFMDWCVPARVPPGHCRILIFGESAAYGSPLPEASFARYLQVMLETAFPDIPFEMLNTACPGINSSIIQAQAHALAGTLDADFAIVYMGNNEGNMPYGPRTYIGKSDLLSRPAFVRLHMRLRGTRLFQWLWKHSAAWTGAQRETLTFIDNSADRILYDRFRRNFEDVLASCIRSGAYPLYCTLGRNRYEKGIGGPVDIEKGVTMADGRFASYFLNDAIHGVPRGKGELVDIEKALLAACAEGYAPGFNFFHDVVHFNFQGNYLAARTLFEALAPHIAARYGRGDLRPEMLSRAGCESLLGLTAAVKLSLLQPLMTDAVNPERKAQRQWCATYRGALDRTTEGADRERP
jgi:hypothetical protein